MIRMRPRLDRVTAENLFNRKASPDSMMDPKAFMKKQMTGMKNSIYNYGRNVVGGAKIGGGAIKLGVKKAANMMTAPMIREMKMNDARDKQYRAAGKALNAAYSGRKTGAAVSPTEAKTFKYGYKTK